MPPDGPPDDPRQVDRLRRRLELILASAGEGIYGLDSEGRTTFVNPAGAAMLGWRPEELAGTFQHEVIHHSHPDGTPYPRDACPIYASFTDGKVHRVDDEVFWRRDGSSFPVEYTSTPIREDGRLVGAVVTFRDVTERRRAEAELARSRQQLAVAARLADLTAELERSNAELDQFAYVASHDLKAPLRGIANLAGWIAEDLGDAVPAETAEHLELLQSRVRRMEALIDGLLEYSRVGRANEASERIDTDELVRTVVDLLDPPQDAVIEVAPDLPVVEGQRLPLQQVFHNLIANALKFSTEGEPRVAVTWHDAGDRVRFSVSDNGPGISPEHHDKVWGMFQTLQPRDEIEGTGIGLALVKKAVESQGGKVAIDSVVGAGATFTFDWPKRR